MRTLIIILTAAAALAGCATSGDYKAYVDAQAAAQRLAVEAQKPIVRITAQPGQPITGLQSVEVYAPAVAPVVQQARPSEWAGVLGQGLAVTGTVLGIQAAGRAAIGLSDSVGRAGAAGYQYIQAPGAVTTVGDYSGAQSGNSGRLAGGDITDSTHAPTVVMQPAPVTQPAPVVVQQQ